MTFSTSRAQTPREPQGWKGGRGGRCTKEQERKCLIKYLNSYPLANSDLAIAPRGIRASLQENSSALCHCLHSKLNGLTRIAALTKRAKHRMQHQKNTSLNPKTHHRTSTARQRNNISRRKSHIPCPHVSADIRTKKRGGRRSTLTIESRSKRHRSPGVRRTHYPGWS